jgi:hypothetical protein
MKFYWLILSILTVWRITHFLQAEDGPLDVVVRLRRSVGEGYWGKLLDCFYCLSVWISVPFAYLTGETWLERALLWPSLSAGAILLERITNFTPKVPPVLFTEEPSEENHHVMLRSEKEPDPPRSPSAPDDQ